MTETLPTLSVVIPTYRRNDLLARSLDALAPGTQTLDPDRYEVVATDDGPPDENARAMLAERYPWARWTQGPRRGPATNRNHGAAQVRADWIVFTDDDCVPDPGWLHAYAAALADPTHANVQVFEGKTLCRDGLSSPFETAPVNESGGLMWTCNLMVRRDLHLRIGGFDESFPYPHLEDVDYRVRLLAVVERAPFVPDAVVDHPPRPLGPILRQVQGHRSALVYAHKHRVPLSRLGLTPAARLKAVAHRFRQNLRFGLGPAFRYLATRDLPETVALAYWIPKWRRADPSST